MGRLSQWARGRQIFVAEAVILTFVTGIVPMEVTQKHVLMGYLERFLTVDRKTKIDAVLAQRTRYLSVVAEDFHNAHNASAILRTCEGLGIQDVHVVENRSRFKPRKGPASGSEKWVSLHRYNDTAADNTETCIQNLRAQGYRLVATSPHADALPPEEVPLDQKLAVMLGNEKNGLSEAALAAADLKLTIPIVGFMESLNVSVSAALCLYTLTRRLRQLAVDWPLSEAERLDLRLDWFRLSVRNSDHLEKHFLMQQGWAS